ncbi:MAG: efflux RND transporter periplasmic adaptor subunit [Phycisphaerales bacterium]|nr:efflux RND transporter periplasmic adaptor subunit [Phycisphaerales bacterium]
MPVPKVVAAEAEMREAPSTVSLVGTLEPLRRSRVGSEVGGLIVEMPVRQGDPVAAGQPLCRLNPDIVSLRLKEGAARLAALTAVHQELLAGTREEELRRLNALLLEAEARVARWKFEKDRVEKLYSGSEAGSVREVYDAAAEHDMALQRRNAAAAAHDEAVKGPRAETIARAAQDVAEQRAVVDRLQRELEKMTIKAPFAGTIVARRVEVGEWLSEGGQVVEVVDLESVLVRVDAPESAVGQVRVGDASTVFVDALKRGFDGKVRHVIPQVNEQARTFPVEIEVPNGEGALAAGMFARVTMLCGAPKQVVCVPKDAVLMRDGVNYVALVAPGEQGALMGIPLAVTTGASVEDRIAITSDNLAAGTKVIVRGNERVFMPMPVEVVDANGTPVKVEFPAAPGRPASTDASRPGEPAKGAGP